jgi:protein-tyrosine phosphatase
MVDLHCHILPGLDDGAATLEDSLGMAEVAAADGITTMVATPHIRDDHPFRLDELPARLDALNRAVSDRGIPLKVLGGGEVAISSVDSLDDQALKDLCLGNGPYLLVESPYTQTTELLENTLFDVQTRGFHPILAHPERSPSLVGDTGRLRTIVERGVLCSVTAGSMYGRFGRTVQKQTGVFFREGLVHDVASDAHDSSRRAPKLREGFERLDESVPGLLDQIDWYTRGSPEAVVTGEGLPPRPPLPSPRGWSLGRMLRR